MKLGDFVDEFVLECDLLCEFYHLLEGSDLWCWLWDIGPMPEES
jgi:hypothetical protein